MTYIPSMFWMAFILFFLACAGAASTGALFKPGDWYDGLDKPRWTPPDWVFPVVWTVLYIASAYAAALVAFVPGNGIALAFWALQLVLNAIWSPVFFGLRRMGAALVILAGLWLAVAGTLVTFATMNVTAGLLILPYLVWVTIAGALNLSVLRRNPAAA